MAKNLTLFVYPTNPRKIPHSPHALSPLLCACFSSMRASAYLRIPTCSTIFTILKIFFFQHEYKAFLFLSLCFFSPSVYSFYLCSFSRLSYLDSLTEFEVAYRFAALAPSNPRKAPCFIRIAGKLKDITSSACKKKGERVRRRAEEEGDRTKQRDYHFRSKIACLPSRVHLENDVFRERFSFVEQRKRCTRCEKETMLWVR